MAYPAFEEEPPLSHLVWGEPAIGKERTFTCNRYGCFSSGEEGGGGGAVRIHLHILSYTYFLYVSHR